MPDSRLPARPSLEQLRKRAKELLRAARAADSAALARLRAAGVDRQPLRLADAQQVLAKELGFRHWAELRRNVETTGMPNEPGTRPLLRPVALQGARPWRLPDGTIVSTEDVWSIFVATHAGDAAAVRALVGRTPGLALVEYNYTPPIHFAVREGHLPLVEFLLDRGADLAYRSYPFGDALLTMAEDREHDGIAALLRRRLSRRFALAPGTKEIIDAARAGDLGRVRAELARDPGLARAANETGDTALHHAAQGGHGPLVRALLDAGANADAIRGDGYRPIHLALMPNWLVGPPPDPNEVANLLLEKSVRYSMFVAALRHDVSFIRGALRRDRARANEEDTNHHRPISAAVRVNDVALARLLLEHGADPNLPEEGASRGHALWIAVHDRRHELVRLLLAHGADPNAEVESSGTPMMMAERDPVLFELLKTHGGSADRSEPDELFHLLKQRRFDEVERRVRQRPDLLPDPGASWWQGILAGPARDGDHEVLSLLMRLGARVPQVSEWAPFYYFKHETTARFLLEHGMDPNHMNWHRVTLLHHMAAEGELGKARLLVDHGADIDALDDEYRSTPLGMAVRRGQRDLVAFLLEHDADPSLAAAAWATPLAWARKRRHGDLEEALMKAGAA